MSSSTLEEWNDPKSLLARGIGTMGIQPNPSNPQENRQLESTKQEIIGHTSPRECTNPQVLSLPVVWAANWKCYENMTAIYGNPLSRFMHTPSHSFLCAVILTSHISTKYVLAKGPQSKSTVPITITWSARGQQKSFSTPITVYIVVEYFIISA